MIKEMFADMEFKVRMSAYGIYRQAFIDAGLLTIDKCVKSTDFRANTVANTSTVSVINKLIAETREMSQEEFDKRDAIVTTGRTILDYIYKSLEDSEGYNEIVKFIKERL